MTSNSKTQNKSFFRPEIDAMKGYVPGEQPQKRPKGFIKLNTNENPYPSSRLVKKLLSSIAFDRLRLYPDPVGNELRKTIASLHRLKPENVILGNGSDDILAIAVRSFVGQNESIACLEPDYSLYPVLSQIQGAKCIKIPLGKGFSLPLNLIKKAARAKIFMISRPNAPTGTTFPINAIKNLCSNFHGIVLIDEAYADFAKDNCIGFIKKFPNVIISRTLSKSYSLAGVRIGYALAQKKLINGMMKVKDSYNVNFLTQKIASAALQDQEYLRKITEKIRKTRGYLIDSLRKKGFEVCDSEANFVFASPPDGNAGKLYKYLKKNGILIRYFPGPATGKYVRITVGTDRETKRLLELL